MLPPGRPVRPLLLLCLLAGGLLAHDARAASPFERSMARVGRLCGDFKFEQALKQLNQARSVTRSVGDEVTVSLYEGILLFELHKPEQARARFLAALLLKPEVRLPLAVSPKVEAEFEAQRARAMEKLADDQRVQTPSPPPPSPPPLAQVQPMEPPAQKPVSAPPAAVASDRPESKPAPELAPPPASPPPRLTLQRPGPGRGARPLPLILLGASVVAGGVGTGFGLASRGEVGQMQAASFQDEAISHYQAAGHSALTANVLFATAGVAAVGAVVSWLLLPHPASSESVENP